MTSEQIAQWIRQALHMDAVRLVDGMTVLTKARRYFGVSYRRVPDADMPDAEAKWISDKKEIWIRQSVYAGMNAGVPRSLMAVTHEVVHAVRGHVGIYNRSVDRSIEAKTMALSPKIRMAENEAKRVAPAILAPAKFVGPRDTVEDLMKRFCLSRQAAEIRLSELRSDGETRRRKRPTFVEDLLNELKQR